MNFFKCLLLSLSLNSFTWAQVPDPDFQKALNNGVFATEGFDRSQRFVDGWLAHADPVSGLLPRRLDAESQFWNAADSAADCYPFMVITTSITNRSMYNGRMLDMLNSEIKLTSRVGAMPDTYVFATQTLEENDLRSVIFGASEYIKDGLLPATEWLGETPWSDRMFAILDEIWANATISTPFGNLPSIKHEVAGELLQVMARVYWMTGEQKYLDWAIRIGDYFLLGDNHPTINGTRLRLRDHGNEVIAGLAELYATVSFANPEKKQAYQAPMYAMLDKILEIGRNSDGLLYSEINTQTGTHESRLADTWGYVLNAHYTVYLVDGVTRYRDAVLKPLESIGKDYYKDTHRFEELADGYADAIESALNLYHRENIVPAERYLDASIVRMWAIQNADGVIESWYGDGNFARTSIMYSLWKTQGLTIRDWNNRVNVGAVMSFNINSPVLTDFSATSAEPYELNINGSNFGAAIYTDKVYTITQLPASLETETLILTANEDRTNTSSNLVSFTAPGDITVFVGVDERTTSLPNWMADWNSTGEEIVTSSTDLKFNLHSKTYASGSQVVLGGAQAAGFQSAVNPENYIAIVKSTKPQGTKVKNTLKISLNSSENWSGKLLFDTPRHQTQMKMPLDWTRINQFPEWYTVDADTNYVVDNITLGTRSTYKGSELTSGIDIKLATGQNQYIKVYQESSTATKN